MSFFSSILYEAVAAMKDRQGVNMVFNAERSLFPFDQEVHDLHPLSETSFKYLNSGFIVGKTETFKEMLSIVNADKIPDDHDTTDGRRIEPNDQPLLQRFFVVERKRMGLALDTRAEICQTLSGVLPEELDFDGPLIENRETGTTPVALHCNGRKEDWWPLLLEKLKL